ncbi:MAG: hypothetical protein HY654_00875 [Acidobacteria bacterium]|nr:hypothetical protein [Acidobacteriota bacterium]
MRVTFATAFRNGLADLQQAAEELANRQRQVSSGRRVQAPSDDPAAARRIVAEQNEWAALDQYARAADSVGSRLTIVDTILSDIIDKVIVAKTAAAGTVGSQVSASQREAAALAVEAARDTILADINTSFHSVYLFSGSKSTTIPYSGSGGGISAYQGNATEVRVDLDRQISARVTLNADAIVRGSDVDHVFKVMTDLAASIRAGDVPATETGMAALDNTFNRAIQAQSQVGQDLRTTDERKVYLGNAKREAAARLSGHRDANMIEAISGMNRADTAYRAALGAMADIGRLSLMDFLK